MQSKNKNRDSSSSRGKVSSILGVLAGLAILFLVVYWTGFSNITKAIGKGGPALFLLVLFYPIELISRGYGWKCVYPDQEKPGTGLFFVGIWFSQSINRLLPTATIGGDIIRGRFLNKKGGDKTAVITSLIADKTAHAVATVVILILGLMLTLTKPTSLRIIIIIATVSLVLSVLIYIFIRLQRSSGVSGFLEKWSGDDGGFLSIANRKAEKIEVQLENIYANPRPFILSTIVRVAGDIALAAEIWVAAWLMNTPISIIDALTLRLITFGVRSVAFIIWGGMGIQESTYALLSAFVGLSPAALVAISLATRVREIITAIPGAAFWMGEEGYEALKKSKSESPG